MEQQNSGSSNLFDISIDSTTSIYLKGAAKWAKFLAIIGFIFTGFVALASLFAGGIYSTMFRSMGLGSGFGVLVTIVYLAGALLYFFPCLYLYNFASKAQAALQANDQNGITESFRNLKRFFKFVGILTIIGIAFLLLAFILGIAFGTMMAPKY